SSHAPSAESVRPLAFVNHAPIATAAIATEHVRWPPPQPRAPAASVPFSAPRAPARLGCGVSGGTQAVVVLSPAPVSPPPLAVSPTRSVPITMARRQLYSQPAS